MSVGRFSDGVGRLNRGSRVLMGSGKSPPPVTLGALVFGIEGIELLMALVGSGDVVRDEIGDDAVLVGVGDTARVIVCTGVGKGADVVAVGARTP